MAKKIGTRIYTMKIRITPQGKMQQVKYTPYAWDDRRDCAVELSKPLLKLLRAKLAKD